MLELLRIRRKALKESDLKKYLLFAFGEILLVMIGILLALQVNKWNEARKNGELKSIYFQNLYLDVGSDIEVMKDMNLRNDFYEREGLYLLAFFEEKLIEVDTQRIKRATLLCHYLPSLFLKSSTYNDLVNSGNLKLIEDIELKKLLNDYYSANAWDDNFGDRIEHTMWYDFRDELIKFIDPLMLKVLYLATFQTVTVALDLEFNQIDLSKYKEFYQIDLSKYKIEWVLLKNNVHLKKQLKLILAYRILIRKKFITKLENAKDVLISLESTESK